MKQALAKRLDSFGSQRPNVYIIPNKSGLKFGLINFLIFLIAMSYSNNLALICSFIMTSFFIIKMLEAHRIVNDTFIENLSFPELYEEQLKTPINIKADQLTEEALDQLQIEFKNDGETLPIKLSGLSKINRNSAVAYADQLPMGKFHFQRIKISTKPDNLLFYVWRNFSITKDFYVFPKAQQTDEKVSSHKEESLDATSENFFAQHKKFTPGDITKRIDWKVFAKTDQLFIKQFHDDKSTAININFDQLSGDSKTRARKISYFLHQLYQHKTPWSLTLPSTQLPIGHSRQHYLKSMELISEL